MATGQTSGTAWSVPAGPIIHTQRKHELKIAEHARTRYPARTQPAAVVKLVYTQASGACGLYARGGSSPLSRTPTPLLIWASLSEPLSSRGLGRRPLTAETGVRIPVAVLHEARPQGGFRRSQGS